MSLGKVIAGLQSALDTLQAMNHAVPDRPIPPQGITLSDAFTRLRAIAPSALSISVYPPEIQWHKWNEDQLELSKWKVWHSSAFYEADTLLAAVEMVERAHAGPVDEAETAAAILDSLTEETPTAPLPPVDDKLKEPAF